MVARERALPAARQAIRACANAIRAIHRAEWDLAHRLMDEARTSIEEGLGAVHDHPEIRYAGYLQDAQKEYSEARLTEAVVSGAERPPAPEELGVEDAPYLNGLAEAIGEARRHILDLLRQEKELNWTFLSPSALFIDGERTGKFRLGTDQLLTGADGKSWISFADYAIAMADEIERPAHMRKRFTVGY